MSISVQINHLSYFSSLLKLVQHTVNGESTPLHSRVNHHIKSKVSSLELSEREEEGEEIGDRKMRNQERQRGEERGRGGK